MNKIITFSITLLISVNFLFAQSKKELDLRIDTLQTALNTEKQVVENLTLQIKNLTSGMEKTNNSLTFLSSQTAKQDSMNKKLLMQLKNASIRVDSITQLTFSAIKKTSFPENLFIDILGLYADFYVYPTPKVNTNLNELQMLDIFNEPYTCIEKGNIETVGPQTKQWYRINENINENLAQGWVLGANFTFLQPDVNTDIAEFAGIYEIMAPHPAHELIFVEVDKITQKIKVMTMSGSYNNGNITWCGYDDSKTNDFSTAIKLNNPKISGCSLTSDSLSGWFAKAEDPAKKIKTVKGLILGESFYRKVK
jgi:hypothetical protein